MFDHTSPPVGVNFCNIHHCGFVALCPVYNDQSCNFSARNLVKVLILFLIILPHRSTAYVDASYSCRPCSLVCGSVGLSVCLSVGHSRDPCKSDWTDRYVIWVVDSDGPKKACDRWARIPERPDECNWTIHVRRRCGLFVKLLWPLVFVFIMLPWWITVITVVLLSTRQQGYKSHQVIRLRVFFVGNIHTIRSSQASLLHHKPHRALLSSLLHRCRHFSTTSGLHWTSWTRWVVTILDIVFVVPFTKTYPTFIVAVTGTWLLTIYCHLQMWNNIDEPQTRWEISIQLTHGIQITHEPLGLHTKMLPFCFAHSF